MIPLQVQGNKQLERLIEAIVNNRNKVSLLVINSY